MEEKKYKNKMQWLLQKVKNKEISTGEANRLLDKWRKEN